MTCECHDTEEQHEQWFKEESAYWRAYFPEEWVRRSLDDGRFYKEHPEED